MPVTFLADDYGRTVECGYVNWGNTLRSRLLCGTITINLIRLLSDTPVPNLLVFGEIKRAKGTNWTGKSLKKLSVVR